MMIVDGVVLWRLNASVMIITRDFFMREVVSSRGVHQITHNYRFFSNLNITIFI